MIKPTHINNALKPHKRLNNLIFGLILAVFGYSVGIEFAPESLRDRINTGIKNATGPTLALLTWYAKGAEESRKHAGDAYSSDEDGLPDTPEEVLGLLIDNVHLLKK